MRTYLAAVAALAATALAGCYDTGQRVLERGQDVALPAGTYHCVNTDKGETSTAVVSAPVNVGGEVVQDARLDKSAYRLRLESSNGGLIIVEADEAGRIYHMFLKRDPEGAFGMLVPDDRARLEALARRTGVTLSQAQFGPGKPGGAPDNLRAFLRAHTEADLKRTATCVRRA